MKTIKFLLAFTLSLTLGAALASNPDHKGKKQRHTDSRHCYADSNGICHSDVWGANHHADGSTDWVGAAIDMSCSPKTLTKNTAQVESALNQLAQNQLSERAIFVQKVSDFKTLSTVQKIDEAYRLIGIKNPKNGKEIMGIIYAREPSAESIANVTENMNLSPAEAKQVIQTVVGVLKH